MKSKKSILKSLAQGRVTRTELPGLLEGDQGIFILQDGKFIGTSPVDAETNKPLTYNEAKALFPNRIFLHFNETELVSPSNQ